MTIINIPGQTLNVVSTSNTSQTRYSINIAPEAIDFEVNANSLLFNVTSGSLTTNIAIPSMNSGVSFTYNAISNVYSFQIMSPTGPNAAINVASSTINPNTSVVTVPSPVTNVIATPGNTTATVSWTPGANGGAPITSYTVYTSDLQHYFTKTDYATNTAPVTLTFLTNGQNYTIDVVATNALGNSTPANSAVITPMGNTSNATPLTLLETTWGFFGGTNVATIATQLVTTPGIYTPKFNQPSGSAQWEQSAVIGLIGNPTLVNKVNNEGPNPGSTQLQNPNGLVTTANNLTQGNFLLLFNTCACYSNKHSSRTLTDSQNNNIVNQLTIQGLDLSDAQAQGQSQVWAISQSQELDIWTVSSIKNSGSDTFQQNFLGGDSDYQAFHGLQFSGVTGIIPPVGTQQNVTTQGANNVTPGPITVLANQVPCLLVAIGTNTSSNGSNYTLTVGTSQNLTVPFPPSNVVATAGNTTATVYYTASNNNGGSPITSYTIYSTDLQHYYTTNNNPATMTALTNGQSYTFNVVATNAIGNSAPGVSNSVVPTSGGAQITVPSAPTNVLAYPGNAAAVVSWSPSASNGNSAITSYTVSSTDGAHVYVKTDYATNATPVTMTLLTNGTPITFDVYATNAAGNSANGISNTVTPTINNTVPLPPTNVTAYAGNTTATVSWTPGANGGLNIISYTVISTDGLHSYNKTDYSTNTSPVTLTGLTNGLVYTFNVYATNSLGNSANGVSNQVTPTFSTAGFTKTGLSVQGNTFVNATGAKIQLRGSNMSGKEYDAIDGYTEPEPDFAYYATWKPNIARIPLNAAAWLGLTCYTSSTGTSWTGGPTQADSQGNYRAQVTNWARDLLANNCYVILDLHWCAPQFTFGGVTHYLLPNNQSPFMDRDTALPFWQSIASIFGTQATPIQAGGNNSCILFELFNEPMIHDEQAYHGVVYSAGDYETAKRVSGTANAWGDNNGHRFPNQTWNVLGYQDCLNAIRATGANNICICNGDIYSSMLEMQSVYKPTDTLSNPQLAYGWHPYPDGSYPYTGSGNNPYGGIGVDSGGGTANWYQWASAIIANNQPVIITEDGGQAGSNFTQGEPHITYMQNLCDSIGMSYLTWNWTYIAANGTQSQQFTEIEYKSDGKSCTAIQGQGVVQYNWMVNHAP